MSKATALKQETTMKTAPVKAAEQAKPPATLESHAVGDIMINFELMAQIDKLADRMAGAKNTIPKHLQNSPGDCWAVIMQSIQWKMNPFAVAQKTHLVNGTLGYEAQLVNAVVQSSGAVSSTFKYQYDGEGGNLSCRVGAVLKGDHEITWGEWLCIGSVKVKNSPLWATNPKQQLGYLQVKNWARLYCPGAILGVYTPDEIEAMPAVERDMGRAEVVGDDKPSRSQSVAAKLSAKAGTSKKTEAEQEPDSVQVITESDADQLRQAIEMAGSSEERFCQKVGIDKLDDLPLARFAGAMDWLRGLAMQGAEQEQGDE